MNKNPNKETYQRLHRKGLVVPSREHGIRISAKINEIWDKTPYKNDHFERHRAACELFSADPLYYALYQNDPGVILHLVEMLLDREKGTRVITQPPRQDAGSYQPADAGGPNGNRGPYSGRPSADLLEDADRPSTPATKPAPAPAAAPRFNLAKMIQEERRNFAQSMFFDTAKVFGVPILESTAEQTILCGQNYIKAGKSKFRESKFELYNGYVMVDLGSEAELKDRQKLMKDVWPDRTDPRIDLICAKAKERVGAHVSR